MATTVTTETLFEGDNIIVKQVSVNAASDETAAEQVVIDKSTLVGPGLSSGTTRAETANLSLMEATWSMNSVWEGAQLYWHDEANNSLILEMVGDSSVSFRGIGGKSYGAEAEAGDGDVLLDLTNAEEAAGSAQFVFVFKKKD